jgi:hypothetical protein
MRVPAHALGKRGRCAGCGRPVEVREDNSEVVGAPPPPPEPPSPPEADPRLFEDEPPEDDGTVEDGGLPEPGTGFADLSQSQPESLDSDTDYRSIVDEDAAFFASSEDGSMPSGAEDDEVDDGDDAAFLFDEPQESVACDPWGMDGADYRMNRELPRQGKAGATPGGPPPQQPRTGFETDDGDEEADSGRPAFSNETNCARCRRAFRGDWDKNDSAIGRICHICANLGTAEDVPPPAMTPAVEATPAPDLSGPTQLHEYGAADEEEPPPEQQEPPEFKSQAVGVQRAWGAFTQTKAFRVLLWSSVALMFAVTWWVSMLPDTVEAPDRAESAQERVADDTGVEEEAIEDQLSEGEARFFIIASKASYVLLQTAAWFLTFYILLASMGKMTPGDFRGNASDVMGLTLLCGGLTLVVAVLELFMPWGALAVGMLGQLALTIFILFLIIFEWDLGCFGYIVYLVIRFLTFTLAEIVLQLVEGLMGLMLT